MHGGASRWPVSSLSLSPAYRCLYSVGGHGYNINTSYPMIRKVLLIALFTTTIITTIAQPYTYKGEKYDWKWSANEFMMLPKNSLWDVFMTDPTIQHFYIEVYLSKSGRVAVSVPSLDFSGGFQADLSLTEIKNTEVWIQEKNVLDGNMSINRNGFIRIRVENNIFELPASTSRQNQNVQAYNWMAGGKTPEKPQGPIYYFRDFHIKLSSKPQPSFGSVYIHDDGKRVVQENGPASEAEKKINKQALRLNSDYTTILMAYPRAGYVLDGFILKGQYAPDKDLSAFYLRNTDGSIMRSGDSYILGKSTLKDKTSEDPMKEKGYTFNAVSSTDIYAVFREASSMTIYTNQAGTLKDMIVSQNAQDADNLIINGPINKTDIEYLKQLSTTRNLVRIDLLNAVIEELPSRAFSVTPLYEIRLPKSLKRINSNAFAGCYSLLAVSIPPQVELGENVFLHNYSKNITVDNDNGQIGHFDEIPLPPLSQRTDVQATAEVMPTFPGGETAMQKFLAENLRYPALAKEMGVKGHVLVEFAVEKSGKLTSIGIAKGVDRQLDKEAVRLVKTMPKWIPGKNGTQPVTVKKIIPVSFK